MSEITVRIEMIDGVPMLSTYGKAWAGKSVREAVKTIQDFSDANPSIPVDLEESPI